ncbi:outer membrane protein [Sphingomonas bacterium]|uniref:outer membrane protein n=1 Tax=Sphingomonas bacterium TaxID=1895847 RepID=UPI00157613BD|nr:opacity protein [Sphingomonas bacterium]
MRILSLVAAFAAATAAAPALAQDSPGAPAPGEATAPDGSKAFGIDPYVAVLGGWEGFDNKARAGIPRQNGLEGSEVTGIAGVNLPLGPVFVGVEGNAAKGVSGAIDWEYGAAGRAGLRVGDSGLFYGKVGYEWVNFDHLRNGGNTKRDYHDITYGAGVEVGPKDVGLGGLTGRAGVRLRLEVSTFGQADSFRPAAGLVFHF